MPARTSELNQAVRARAKNWLGWGTGSQAKPASRGFRRWISDAVMHNTLDMALRYRPIVTHLRPLIGGSIRIVEVGSGSAGITPYLHHNVIGVDRDFDGPRSAWLQRCIGDVMALPFADRSVDFTVCVDTLEHVPPNMRAAAVTEILRITRKVAVIAVPCGPLSAQRDRDLSLRLRKRLARHDRFVDEHIEHGLPGIDDLSRWVVDAGTNLDRRFTFRTQNNVNLRVWWLVQTAKISLVWRALLIMSFPIAFPILRQFNAPPTYRQILFVESNAEAGALRAAFSGR